MFRHNPAARFRLWAVCLVTILGSTAVAAWDRPAPPPAVLLAQVPPPDPKPGPRPPAPVNPAPAPIVPDTPVDPPAPPPFVPRVHAKAVITTMNGGEVPAQWPCGVSIMLSAKQSIAGNEVDSVGWEVEPPWVDQFSVRSEANHTLTVSTGTKPKHIVVILTAAKDDTYSKATVIIDTVVDPDEPGPAPNPPPGPPPGPPLVPINPLNTRAQLIYTMVTQNVPATADRAQLAQALATVYTQAAANIGQAVALNPPPPNLADYKTPDGIVKATARSIQTALGTGVDAWRPFFVALRTYLNGLGDAGQLNDAGAHIPVFQDIAAGLGAVR